MESPDASRADDAGLDPLAEEEAGRAAAEAAGIGGSVGDDYEGLDPAERPLAEAGQGHAEGFELAEQELIENASHEQPGGASPTAGAGRVEEERSGAVYGEPDEVDPSEVVGDPEAGPGDPGEGPGPAPSR